jgi:ectoine hydroxylase-related dioxygenase (phytanoyl-CoA dioxygenase family)
VIPGSHRVGDGFAEALQKQVGHWDGRDIPAMALETKPGDVVVFNHNLKHAAFGGGSSRRMFTINCAQRFPESKLDDLRGYINGHARFWIDRLYGETMIQTASARRKIHLEQVMANDGQMKALAERARATMREPARG